MGFFFQAEDGIRDRLVTGVQTCALPILNIIADPVNYINAPALAEEHGIGISQTKGLGSSEFANAISCRANWADGNRVIIGSVFDGERPRIVQVGDYHLDVDPSGTLLVMKNSDVPGVIGQVGTLLGDYGVNIGEWRLGRVRKIGRAHV